MRIIEIVKKLYPFDYSVAGEGNELAIRKFKNFLNFKIHSFSTSKYLNGWKIPVAQKVNNATIYSGKNKILDKKNSVFHTISQTISFKGELSGKDLAKKLTYSKLCPDAIPYNWTGLYRPNQKTWGFSVKKKLYDKIRLSKKRYSIDVNVKNQNYPMRVLDYEIKGKSKQTIIINAHNCHKFQANDDISGCAVGIKIFEYLKKNRNLNYSYRLLIAPELFGPLFWLKKFNKSKSNFIGAILLKAVGNRNKLKLQSTFNTNTFLDKATELAIKKTGVAYKKGNFRTIYGNDETVFEAPGYNIPSLSITRYPFKEYHTSADTPSILSEKNLNNTFEIVKNTISIIENNYFVSNNHTGLICLSNKKYDLYKPAYSPGISNDKYTKLEGKWNLLMNCLPMEAEKKISILDLAYNYDLDFFDLYNYLLKWRNKKLLKFKKIKY